MRANSLFYAAVFALAASAQNSNLALPQIGPSKPGFGNTPEATQVSADAGRHPNGTSSVNFTRTYNNTQEDWTWRINVSDISVPNQIDNLGMQNANFSEGLHVANTQWQLHWPGDDEDSLQEYLTKRNMKSVGFNAMISSKPTNITDNYHDSDNGNCTSMLGEKCTQSLMEAASGGETFSFAGLDGCESTLDTQADGGVDSGSGWTIEPTESDSNNSNNTILYSNDTLLFYTSETYTSDNTTLFNQSERALQVLTMSFKYGQGPQGENSNATVLCRIVDNSQGDSSEPSSESAAVGRRHSMAAVWSVVVLITLVVVWQ